MTDNTYTFEISEHVSRLVTVTADDANAAYRKLREMYRNCEIILGADDYVQTEILMQKS